MSAGGHHGGAKPADARRLEPLFRARVVTTTPAFPLMLEALQLTFSRCSQPFFFSPPFCFVLVLYSNFFPHVHSGFFEKFFGPDREMTYDPIYVQQARVRIIDLVRTSSGGYGCSLAQSNSLSV